MTMARHLWMVSYDVTDDRTRRQLAAQLHAFGERVQFSVFECHFTVAEARYHLGRMAQALDPATDSLRAYPLCAWCEPAVTWLGTGSRSADPHLWVV